MPRMLIDKVTRRVSGVEGDGRDNPDLYEVQDVPWSVLAQDGIVYVNPDGTSRVEPFPPTKRQLAIAKLDDYLTRWASLTATERLEYQRLVGRLVLHIMTARDPD